MDRLEPGQAITTQIVAISGDTIFTAERKRKAFLPPKSSPTRKGTHRRGGRHHHRVFSRCPRGEYRHHRISGESANQDMLENAWRNGIPVEGVVEKEIKGGFEVQIGKSRAFCPFPGCGTPERRRVSGWKAPFFKITR